MSLINRESGEVADEQVIADRAHELILLTDEAAQVASELAEINKARDRIRAELLEVMPPDGVISTASGDVVRVKGNRPAQRVDARACQRWAEELEDLGLGERRFAPAGIALFRSNQARIRAAHVPYDELVPEPPEPPDTLQVVPR